MSFLLSLLGLFQVLSVRVEWLNDYLSIRLHENLSDYRYQPSARLIIDDQIKDDPHMYYEYDGVERTFISTVNTSVVKAYYIKYRVYFPSYNITQVHTITFNVYDDTPPEFVFIPTYSIPVGSKLPNLLEGVVVKDNYDQSIKLTLSVSTVQVMLTKVGTYPITYQLKDVSGNTTTQVVDFVIYDEVAPDITLKKEPVISYGALFKYSDFFNITDNYDKVLTVMIDDHLVDYHLLGNYPIQIKAIDSSGNTSIFNHHLRIIDTVKPVIKLKTIAPPIPYGQWVTESFLKTYILSVTDDYDTLGLEDVIVTHDIESYTLGDYYIYFEVRDSSNNITEVKQKVRVSDLEKPVITILRPLTFEVHSKDIILREYIGLYDNHTAPEFIVLKTTSSQKMGSIGSYLLTIEATDQSQNKAVLHTYIDIVDTTCPMLIQLEDILITDFSKKSLTHYFKATDNYDVSSVIKIEIDDKHVRYDHIGAYEIRATATDTSGNITYLSSEVMVIDIEAPKLNLKQNTLKIELDSQPIQLIDYILEACDNYDHLTIEDVLITGNINYQVIGRYDILFKIEDTSLNSTYQRLFVYVEKTSRPELIFDNVTLKLNETYDVFKGVDLLSNKENITITCYPKTIDTTMPGSQIITYVAMDDIGNYTVKERIFYIENQSATYEIASFIPMAIVTLLSGAAIIYVYKKM